MYVNKIRTPAFIMKRNKIFGVTGVIIAFVSIGMTLPNVFHQQKRNLTVLPTDISDKKLDSLMQSYTVALGVNCNFCHKAQKNMPDSLEYASDENPMKANARKMISMVININTTYFYFDKKTEPLYLNVITCKTCHRGEPFPIVN